MEVQTKATQAPKKPRVIKGPPPPAFLRLQKALQNRFRLAGVDAVAHNDFGVRYELKLAETIYCELALKRAIHNQRLR